MSKIIQIQDINSSDTLKTMVEKINYNFDQIMAFGGGPKGEMGLRGFIGPDGEQGEQGERGNLITVVDDISTVGDNLKAGDLAIYSNDEYIYKVEEIDGEKHFVSTNICIKGDAGKSGTTTSPFDYSGDAIITNPNGTGAVPKYTFIGTDKTIGGNIIGGNIGNLNVVGNDGIHIFTSTNDPVSDNDYCGKIYGGKLDNSENNILVLKGEDGDDSYVKIDDTLLTDKIHSSSNGIKIAEVTNDGVVLGDGSKNASIECNEFTVKNGSKTPIKTSSSRIDLKGNLYVNYENYNYTTAIYGSSIDINTHTEDSSLCVSTCIQANKDGAIIQHINEKDDKYSSISISSNAGIKIDANKVIIGRNSQSNTQINGNATVSEYVTAKVNKVPDVYLGCPIGTVVMWAGNTVPDGWLLCDGSVLSSRDTNYNKLYNAIGTAYGGDRTNVFLLPDLRQKFPLGYNNITRYQQISNVFNSCTDWEYTILSNLVESNGKFKTIGGSISSDVPAKMRRTQKLLIERLIDLYGISITSTTVDSMINEINNTTTIFGLGSTSGELMHTLTENEMPAHSHDINNIRANTKRTSGAETGTAALYTSFADGTAPTIETTGGDRPHNNMPPYLAINFIIKYK